jgi:hypothetical protein
MLCIPFCVLLVMCSKSQPDDDPMGSKHVAVWILYIAVFDDYLLIPTLKFIVTQVVKKLPSILPVWVHHDRHWTTRYETRNPEHIASNLSMISSNLIIPLRPDSAERSRHLTLSRLRLNGIIFNPLNAELNPICHLLALLGAHHILHVSRIRVKAWCSWIRAS